MKAADTKSTYRSPKSFLSNMATSKLKSITKNRKKQNSAIMKSSNSCLTKRHMVVARMIKREMEEDHIRGMMKEVKPKEKGLSRERIEEISNIIRATKMIKKKIKSCSKN